MTNIDKVITALADGTWQSVGQGRAVQQQLSELGLVFETDDSGRLRLSDPIELLDLRAIRTGWSDKSDARIANLELHSSIDSTNAHLQRQSPPPPGRMQVCLAEFQRAGRGRRGRAWIAPFGKALCFSVGWCFERTPADLSALSLAVGIGVVHSLRLSGVDNVGLKWPNDLVMSGRKLGGILIEAQADSRQTAIVIGIGINLRLSAADHDAIAALQGLVATDLASVVPAIERNRLATRLIDGVADTLVQFDAHGFESMREDWQEVDLLAGRDVEVATQLDKVIGRAVGVDATGALLVRVDKQMHRFLSGEVRVRPR